MEGRIRAYTLKSQIGKLCATSNVFEQYSAIIMEQREKGIIQLVPEEDAATKVLGCHP